VSDPKPAPRTDRAAHWRESMTFWSEAFALQGSTTPIVVSRVLVFGLVATLILLLKWSSHPDLGVEVAPYEVAGALLGLLLVVRTNTGYERWWEARKAWGGMINQSRNLVIAALAYGPSDRAWREQMVRWTVAMGYVTRSSLRGERAAPELVKLLGPEHAVQILSADHRPSFVALAIGRLLREALDRHGLNGWAFAEIEHQRVQLIDHVGACERILRSPLPRVNAIIIRRFIVMFLATLPFALILKISDWLTPIVTMLVAYPILSLDQMGVELQNPFDTRHLSHLPLTQYGQLIERNLLALLDEEPSAEGVRAETTDA
jgi:ion channel-forming bestrophin family protein